MVSPTAAAWLIACWMDWKGALGVPLPNWSDPPNCQTNQVVSRVRSSSTSRDRRRGRGPCRRGECPGVVERLFQRRKNMGHLYQSETRTGRHPGRYYALSYGKALKC